MVNMSGGDKIPVIVPSRYHEFYSRGADKKYGRFSSTVMVDFIADVGFDGIDISFDKIDVYEDSMRSVCYSLADRAAARGLILPVCHLPFYMPDPDDDSAMYCFSCEIKKGIEMAELMKIPEAVIHPIVRHSMRCGYESWLVKNLDFLAPLRTFAFSKGVRLAVENMAGIPYCDLRGRSLAGDIVFGSRAEDLLLLAEKLDMGVCWDTGHANLTGLCQSGALSVLRDRIEMMHLHDNDGKKDKHLLPMCPRGSIDWSDVAEGMRSVGFTARQGSYLDFELSTSHMSDNGDERRAFAAEVLKTAVRFATML